MKKKKKIAILGSTGSIGKQTIDLIRKDKKNFDILLLTANNNYNLLSKQIKEFNVKNVIISNKRGYLNLKKKFKKVNVSNDLSKVDKIIKSKLDYVMSSISGFSGLSPTIKIIKKTKVIAIANKESIICGWKLIKSQLNKHKTKFIPVDSEHHSIWSIIDGIDKKKIDKIILTASGGPFFKRNKFKLKKTLKQAINHPTWRMGKKISVDSATLMNKVFEIIEAKKIFNLELNKFNILIHPKSYVHAIVKLKNGLIKIIAHDTNMKIPIFNSIYFKSNKYIKTKKIDLKVLNNLDFSEVPIKNFPLIKILNKIPKNETLYETILVTINDELVNLFLSRKISFDSIYLNLNKLINSKSFSKLKFKKLQNLAQIEKLNRFARLKTKALSVISESK